MKDSPQRAQKVNGGVPSTEVPFAGAAPCFTALLGGHIEGLVLNLAPILPMSKQEN